MLLSTVPPARQPYKTGRLALTCSLLLGVFSACSTGPALVKSSTPVGDWSLQRWVIEGEARTLDAGIDNPTLIVQADGSISGSTSVNRYNGEAEFDGNGRLTISPRIMTTRRAGPPAAMAQERLFLSLLPAITGYRVDNTTLRLENEASWAEFSRID